MKLIQAIIKPLKVDEVKEELYRIGVGGLTVTEVKGLGRQSEDAQGFVSALPGGGLPKMCLEIAVSDDLAEKVIHAILASARTDRVGDGKIFVTDLREAVRVRTGERNTSALS